MTLAEKISAAAAQAKHNEAEAYSTLEMILRDRANNWPAWLQRVAEDVDSIPVNLEAGHGR